MLILSKESMGFMIKDGVIQITSDYAADRHLETRIYDVSGLKAIDPKTLGEMLQATTGNGTWQAHGEKGDLRFVSDHLVVLQNRRTHRQIRDVLEQLTPNVHNETQLLVGDKGTHFKDAVSAPAGDAAVAERNLRF